MQPIHRRPRPRSRIWQMTSLAARRGRCKRVKRSSLTLSRPRETCGPHRPVVATRSDQTASRCVRQDAGPSACRPWTVEGPVARGRSRPPAVAALGQRPYVVRVKAVGGANVLSRPPFETREAVLQPEPHRGRADHEDGLEPCTLTAAGRMASPSRRKRSSRSRSATGDPCGPGRPRRRSLRPSRTAAADCP